MAADLHPVAGGTFHVDVVTHAKAAQRGQRQALLHHVELGAIGALVAGRRQAHAVAGHTGTDGLALQEARRETQGEGAQTRLVGDGCDGGDGLDDAGEHGGWRSESCDAASLAGRRPTMLHCVRARGAA
jgi:hypothetical protein